MFSTSTTTTTSDHYSNSMGINIRPLLMERATTTKWKYNNIEIAPNCPRCASSNTKFCYYNNYSLSQPRYFCKGCRRYWTKGGSLRNVPVGGGCRKSRRSRAIRLPGGPGAHAYADTADAGSADGPHGGACIDMAAVFAKYVDQSQHVENVENVENEESFSSGSFDVDSQLIGVGDDQVQQAMPQLSTCQDVSGQQFVYQDCGGFELQQQGVVLCDELSPDMLWSEGTSLESYGYHQQQQQLPMVQVEDCGLFAPDRDDDQLRISANLVSENWGSFDLSAYEFYSTP